MSFQSNQQEECLLCKEIQGTTSTTGTSRTSSKTGLIFASAFGISALGILAVSIPFLTPALRRICLPFVPATDAQVRNVLQALKSQPRKSSVKPKVVDLGSGDGRIVFSVARQGYQATGVELNPILVYYSRLSALFQGLHRDTSFLRKDLFTVNYSDYDHIVIFGVDSLMPELEEKLLTNKPSSLIACRFPLPNHTPSLVIGEGIDTVWLYQFKDK